LGTTVARSLFDPGMNPLGEMVRVQGMACEVVGVLAERGANAFGADEDDVVLMPITTVQRRILGVDRGTVHFVALSVLDGDRTAYAREDMTALLRERHRLRPDEEDDFVIRDPKALAARITSVTRQLTIGVGVLALISLVVGGIGIMNIMLVSVTERTREVGLRMALGARGGDILAQFVAESVFLSVIGGVLGVAAGVAGSHGVAELLQVEPVIYGWAIALSLLFAASIGLVFGLYPAWRASRLDPIEALRHE
jgi:putative ABC transport system permease protein